TQRTRTVEQTSSARLAETEQRLGEMRAAKDGAQASIALLENELKSMRQDLDAAKKRGEALRATAERVPVLEKEIDDVPAESYRQFEESPSSWFPCRGAGRI